MRLLLFPSYTYPCTHAMLDSVYTEILPTRGYEVRWVMPTVHPMQGVTQGSWNGTHVTLILRRAGSSLIRDGIGSFQEFRDMLRVALKEPSGDIIQVRNEVAPSLVALWLRRKAKARFVFQVSSPDAELRMQMARDGIIKPRVLHLLRGHMKVMVRRWICHQADAVLAISDAMRDYIIEHDGLSPRKVHAFPLGFDIRMIPKDADLDRVRAHYSLDNSPTIVYFGSMSLVRRPEFLVEMLRLVRKSVPEVKLLMVGEGAVPQDLDSLKLAFADAGLTSAVLFTGQVSRGDVGALVRLSDISVSPIRPIFEYVISSPTKVLESLGLGTPVVANREIPDQDAVIRQSGGGELVDYDPGAFAIAVIELLRSPKRRIAMGKRGQEWVRSHRSYEVLANQVESIYQQLIEQSV